MDVDKDGLPDDREAPDVEAHMRIRAEAADRHSRDAEALASRARAAALRDAETHDEAEGSDDRRRPG